ncbi:MAG TPA: cytochrome c [Gemmatimonadaceae bacterium]|jgi:mono/diheme cytochrome c family protein
MTRIRLVLRHPFWQAVILLVVSYLTFTVGVQYVFPFIFRAASAPVPRSVVLQYMFIAIIGILIFVSSDEHRWRLFKEPLHATLVDPDKRWLRMGLLVAVPVLLGFETYQQARPRVDAPIELRSIHPAPPGQITFRGKTLQLSGLENPLRRTGNLADHLLEGRRVYYQNCIACHGDHLDGQGHFAHGFSPSPANFSDNGTIAQLTESYVFWRIAKGGPGLPREGTPWNSAMPVWENYLTEDEIWSVVIFLYGQTGWQPRRWETSAAAGGAK